MTAFGISEFKRWDAEVVQAIPGILAADVRDELVAFDTGLGLTARVQYRGLLGAGPNQPLYQMTPDFIPGRALVYHERKHNLDDLVGRRVGGQYEFGWIAELFKIRGATLPTNQQLAIEQAASMLPEAFIGEWGGYLHPMFGLDPVAVSDGVRVYFATPTAAAVRAFIRGYGTWTPPPPPVITIVGDPPGSGGGSSWSPPVPPPVPSLPELASVYYSQWDPDHVGVGDCVPTSAKMLLRWVTGVEYPIAHLRDAMDLAPDGIRNLARDAGIGLEACRQVLSDRGVPSTAVLSRDLDMTQLLGFVRAGRLPIVFELHGDLPTRMDQDFRGLHAVWLTAVDGGMVEIKDPDRFGPNKADRWLVSISDFSRAFIDGAVLGGGAVIPDEPRKGWDDDMAFTDEDRRKLNRVYDHLEAYEPLVWIKRLQQWLAKAFRSLPVLANADLSGPDVKTGEPFK